MRKIVKNNQRNLVGKILNEDNTKYLVEILLKRERERMKGNGG